MLSSGGLIDTITTRLLSSQNQFASGGLLLMLIGGCAAFLKGVPLKLWVWFTNQFTITLTINDEKKSHDWFRWWFTRQKYAKRMRRMDAYNPWTADGWQIHFTPAPGTHWFWYKGRPLFVTLVRSDEKKVGDAYQVSKRAESYTLWTFGRNQKYMRDLVQEAHDLFEEGHAGKPILRLHSATAEWYTVYGFEPRNLKSVVLPENQKEAIVTDVERFIESEDWYREMGIPFHRGYLFYGPPGTGKTSLVMGLASHFKCSVYVVKLNDLSDTSLIKLMSDVQPDSMVVFEDVDAAINKRLPGLAKKEDDDEQEISLMGVTLSGLLNALDGMQSPAGVMYFMTTNHVEKLDHALLRPGRTDVKVYFGPANERQKLMLYQRFFPSDDEISTTQFIQQFPAAQSMAEFQEVCMLERNRRANSSAIVETEAEAASAD